MQRRHRPDICKAKAEAEHIPHRVRDEQRGVYIQETIRTDPSEMVAGRRHTPARVVSNLLFPTTWCFSFLFWNHSLPLFAVALSSKKVLLHLLLWDYHVQKRQLLLYTLKCVALSSQAFADGKNRACLKNDGRCISYLARKQNPFLLGVDALASIPTGLFTSSGTSQ